MHVAEFHDSVIKLSCLSDISDFSTLNQIYLRNVAMRQVRVADVFVDSVFIVMGYRDKVIQHHIET